MSPSSLSLHLHPTHQNSILFIIHLDQTWSCWARISTQHHPHPHTPYTPKKEPCHRLAGLAARVERDQEMGFRTGRRCVWAGPRLGAGNQHEHHGRRPRHRAEPRHGLSRAGEDQRASREPGSAHLSVGPRESLGHVKSSGARRCQSQSRGLEDEDSETLGETETSGRG